MRRQAFLVPLGEMNLAIELLEPVFDRAQKQNVLWFKSDNSLDALRDDLRMQAMVARADARLAAG